MASNNQLLGSGVTAVKVEKVKEVKSISGEDTGWPKCIYHESCREGKIFQTKQEQEEMYKLGWVESPKDIGKVVEKKEEEVKVENLFGALVEDKKSKVDLSDKKIKKGKK